MTAPKPVPMSPADRWESLVRSGLSEATATAMVRREMARAAIAKDTFGFQAPSVPGIEQAAVPVMPQQQPSDQVPARPVVPSGGSVGLPTQAPPDAVALEDQRLAARGPLVNAALRLPAATFGGITNPVMGLLAPERNAAVQAAARNIAPTAGTGATVGEVGGALLGTGLLYSAGANALAAAPEATLLPRLARSARSTNWATRAKGNIALGLPLDVSFGLQEGRQTGKPVEAIAKNVAMDVVGSGLIEGLRQPGIAKAAAAPMPVAAAPSSEAGTGAVPIMSGVTGGVVGGSFGYASGDTPEQKRERALLGFLGGAAAGFGVGVAAERVGAKVRPPGTEPLPPRGETPAEEYAKLSTFALDPAGEARLRDHLERAGPLTRGDPKTVEPMETVRLVAKSLGVEDVMRGDAARLNRNEVLAIRDIVHTNIDDIERAVNRLADPTISQADREKLAMAIEGMEKQNVALLDRFTVARGEMGRNLNALKILASRTLDPAVWLSKAQSVRGALGVPDEMRASILRFIREGNREGLVKTIMDARQSTPWEKVTTYWSANLLSNPATHVVNVASNAALAGMEQAKMPAAAFADRLMGLATGQHTTAGWTRSMGNASKVGAKRGFRQALNTLKGGMDPATMAKYDVPRQTNYANPILQAYTTSIFRTLGAEDQVFREMALEASLANQAEVMAKAEGWTGEVARARVAQLRTAPSDEMVLRAVGDAEEAVVRDRTAVGDLLGHISGFAPNGMPVGKFVVPFTRTPGAVATRMAEYSPLGLTVGTAKTAKVILDGLRGMDVPPDVQRDAAKLFARGATGTAVLTLGYLLASKGLATGPGEKGQKTWATTSVTGRTPTSVRVDDQWLEIGRFNPVGNLISLGAHLYETLASPEAPEGAVGKASSLVGATARTVLDQPFLLGIQRALEEINLAGAPGRLVEGIAAGFIPASALLSAVARGTDPVQRQTPGVEGYLKSRLPSASKELPPAIDALGEEKPRQGGVVEQMFSPVRRSEDKSDDPVVKAMVENGIQLTELRKRTDETPEDFAKRAVREGRAAHKNLTRLLGQRRWQRATPEARREMFQEEFLRGRRMGRRTAR